MTHVIVAHWRPVMVRPGRSKKPARTGQGNSPNRNLQFTVNRSDNPDEFLLYEQYVNEQAFLDHQQTQHFKTLVLERAVPLLERRERYAYSVFD